MILDGQAISVRNKISRYKPHSMTYPKGNDWCVLLSMKRTDRQVAAAFAALGEDARQ
jgi:hypothetical protein